jgi:imidazolonepropionase-like amidohydrolase
MKALFLLLLAPALLAPALFAQDLAITNARIIVGTGQIINSGTIVIRGGRIVSAAPTSATASPVNTQGLTTIDAKGMTALPGFIDAHRHINTGPNEKAQMQALLEAGYTTILSGGGPAEGNITLRNHIDSGLINGPRIIPSGQVRLLNNTPEQARDDIRKMAALGIKFTGEITVTPFPGPSEQELTVLRAILDEAKRVGIDVQVHAVSAKATVAVVDAGVRHLVHVTNKDFLTKADAQKIAASGAKVLSTVGFGSPVFGVFADDNNARFRDGKPWPDAIPATSNVPNIRQGEEAGHAPVNARTLWDSGVVLGYCTDTGYDPLAGLDHELRILAVMFPQQDLIKIMGPNTAAYLNMSDQLGTLEPGKLADLILLDGNPLEGYWNMLKTKLVVKQGKVVVDKR